MRHSRFSILLRPLFVAGALGLLLLAAELHFRKESTLGRDSVALALLGGAFLLGWAQQRIGALARRARELEERRGEEAFEIDGLRGLVRDLERDRNRLRHEVERLKPEQALAGAAAAGGALDEFIAVLASLVTRTLADARRLILYRRDSEACTGLVPLALVRQEDGAELFLVFHEEGARRMGTALAEETFDPRRLCIRSLEIRDHARERHLRAELGLIRPDRRRTAIGSVRLRLPHPGSDPDKQAARERLKAELARVDFPTPGPADGQERPPRRYDAARNLLELVRPVVSDGERLGMLLVAFSTEGTDPAERLEVWEPLLASAAQHVARAMRGHLTREQAIRDGLTGLYNKAFLQESLGAAVREARQNNSRLALIMIDIDHFKRVNDTWGHLTGDIILKGVARLIASAARATDIPFRYGGEEMGLILPGQTVKRALGAAERLRGMIEAATFVAESGEIVRVTCSLGVAGLDADVSSADELVSRADRALYHSKETGRNRSTAWTAGGPRPAEGQTGEC